MKATKFASLFGCLFLTVVSIGELRAVPNTMITGSASFMGGTTASGASGVGTTTVSFNNDWSFLSGTGTYAGIGSQAASFTSSFMFTGDGNSVVLLSAPVTNFWSFTTMGGTYRFDLAALTNGHVEGAAMTFRGTGTLFGTNLDATPATFSMDGTGTNFTFQFVTNTANSTPDTGSTILLMIVGLTGLFACRRRFERQTLTAQTRKN